MKRTALALTFTLALLVAFMFEVAVEVDANSERALSPTEPIKDPPVIIIKAPTDITYFENLIPLKITVIQPDSWSIYPSAQNVTVVGPTTLRLVSCELDGQPFTLWNGTRHSNMGVSYFLPKDAQFSAIMNVSSGQHELRVNVHVIAQYYPTPNFPFPSKYGFDTSQSVTFSVQTSSDAAWSPTIESIETPTVPSPQDYFLETEAFPVVPFIVALVAVVVAVAAGMFLALRKRKLNAWDETK